MNNSMNVRSRSSQRLPCQASCVGIIGSWGKGIVGGGRGCVHVLWIFAKTNFLIAIRNTRVVFKIN